MYKNSQEVVSLKFNATGTNNLHWFSQANLVSSPWKDLKTAVNINVGIMGPVVPDRYFEVTGPYTDCEKDSGWLVVTNHPVCPWDNRATKPSIQYSKLRKASLMDYYGKKKSKTFFVEIETLSA